MTGTDCISYSTDSCWSIAALRVQSNVLHVATHIKQEKHIYPNKKVLTEVKKTNADLPAQTIAGFYL